MGGALSLSSVEHSSLGRPPAQSRAVAMPPKASSKLNPLESKLNKIGLGAAGGVSAPSSPLLASTDAVLGTVEHLAG